MNASCVTANVHMARLRTACANGMPSSEVALVSPACGGGM